MEKISSHIQLAEWKQSNLCKAHEQLHSEASSFLLFSLQWKDLESHFDSTREMIQTQFQELEGREKVIALKEERLNDVEKSIHECSKELELKKNELRELSGLIEKRDGEVRLKTKELDSAQERLRVLLNDIKVKEGKVNVACMRILDAEKELEAKEKAFDMVRKKIDDFEHVMELKEQKLNGIMMLIEERSMECVLKGKNVESISSLLQEHEEELATKEKQYDAIQMAIKDINGELKLKEKELESIQNMIATKWKEKRLDKIERTIKSRTEDLDLKEKELCSMQNKLKDLSEVLDLKEKELCSMQNKLKDLSEDLLSKESELESIKNCIKEHSKELDVQEKQLDGTQQSIRDCESAVILLTKYVNSIEKAIIECSKEWELKENHFDNSQESLDGYSNELLSVVNQHNSISLTVDKCLKGLKAQKVHFNLLKNSIEERSKNLKNEEKDFEKRIEELNKKDKKVNIILKEIESLRSDMASQMILLEKGREELRLKELQLKVEAEKLESKEKDISPVRASMEKCNEKVKLIDNPNILHQKVKTESGCGPANNSNTLNLHTGSTVDGKLLLGLLCEHLKLHDLVRTELVITLRTSSDPAKLVLDAMRWFYTPQTVSEDAKFELHNVKRGCILLSELLFRFSPQIAPPLKDEALKLAGQWKAKMSTALENHLEVLAFLLLVANYGLASDFNEDELHILLNSVSQYKQAFGLARALGIADKSSEGSATPSLVKLEQPESLPTHEALVSSTESEQLSKDPDQMELYLLKQLMTGQELKPSAILLILKESSDPPKLVLDMIKDSFNQQLKEIGFEESFLRRTILLLKQLNQISPTIDPKVRDDAMKLAVVWKLKIRSDTNDSLDAVGFLQLLVSYGLTTSFSDDEILKLFENIVLHEQASELCLMFGYNQKIQEIVQNLIGTKQFVKAVRFICGYKLESFRPAQLLNEYLRDVRNASLKASKKKNTGQEDVRAAMDEAIDKEIDAVKLVITCIVECNLSSEMSTEKLEKDVVSLEEMRRLKCNNHVQPQSSTKVNMQPPHSIGVRSPQPHTNFEAQRPHPTKGEKQPQPSHWAKSKVQKSDPTHHQPRQQHPPIHQAYQQYPPIHQAHQQYPPAPQTHQQYPLARHPHPSNNAAPRRKKRKINQFQNGSIKYPRKPPTRPVFSSPSPIGHDEESQLPHYSSRCSGMQGLFGLHEGVGHESTEHGNHYTRPTRPIP